VKLVSLKNPSEANAGSMVKPAQLELLSHHAFA